MKYFLPLIIFYSLNTLACPKLAGKYSRCFDARTHDSLNVDLEISQKLLNKIHVFTIKSTDPVTKETSTEVYKADGKTVTQSETDPETGAVVALETTVGCIDNELRSLMELKYNGEVYSQVLTSLSKIDNQLIQNTQGVNENGEQVENQIICE